MKQITWTILVAALALTACRQRGGTTPEVGTERGSGISVPDKSNRRDEFNADSNYGAPGKDPQAQFREVERTNEIPETRGTNRAPALKKSSQETLPGPKDAPDRP